MVERKAGEHVLIGREKELQSLRESLENAKNGKGSTVLISGEPGIGKTALVDAFKEYAATQNVKILSGAASADSAQPFLVFSKALAGEMDAPLFEEQEYTRFVKIFAINPAGMLVAQASSGEEEMDADIFAGMLSAVQNFVCDSLDTAGEQKSGLGRLEYGDMKILIEHGKHLFLTGVFSGGEHPDMKGALKRALQRIEEEHGAALEKWSGKVSEVEPVHDKIKKLTEAKFLVRRDLEGVKLENERIRIADEVLETLLHLARVNTLILFLEDLHWADESSRFVLNYLAKNIRKSQVLLLGTLRPMESDVLQATIEKMRSEKIMDEVRLEKLDIEHTFSLINNTYSPNEFPETLAENLFEQSKGNPLFVIEMLKGMREDGSIAMQGGKYTLVTETYHIPATVEEVVNRRLESLDPDSMAMVEYASCIGQKFDASLAASNRMVKDVDASLEKLLGSGILLRKNGTLEFSHAIFQTVIYNSIGERWKTGHHKIIGEHLESSYAETLDTVIYDIARHFSRTKEFRKCSIYCKRAGEKAEAAFAVEQALGFYNDALFALSKLDDTYAHERILDILERSGDIQELIGEYKTAIESYQRVKNNVDVEETKVRMLRKISNVYEKQSAYDIALSILAEAKALVSKRTSEYGRLCIGEGVLYSFKGEYEKAMDLFHTAIIALEGVNEGKRDSGYALRHIGIIHTKKGEFDLALEHYKRSLATMTEIEDQMGIAAALNNTGAVYRMLGELDRALEFLWRSFEIREKIGDKFGIALCLTNISNTHSDKGEIEKALEIHERCLELRKRIGDRHGAAVSLNNMGNIYRKIGKLDKALELHERSLELRENIGDKDGVAMSLYNKGNVYRDKGESDRALELLERGLEIEGEIGNKQGLAYSQTSIGMVFWDKGELETALEYFNRSLVIAENIGDKKHTIQIFCGLAEVNSDLGNFQKALGYAERGLDISLNIGAKSEEGRCYRNLGRIWRERKDWKKAGEELNNAKKILEISAEKQELAKFYYEYSLLCNDISEPIKAKEHLEKALAEFERMGMKLWAERCRKVLEELNQ
jgi:predicted ATPase/lipopolysaccharide biosynthesis regulator YciM